MPNLVFKNEHDFLLSVDGGLLSSENLAAFSKIVRVFGNVML